MKTILISLASLFVLAIGSIIFFLVFSEWSHMWVYESKSPAGYGTAVFVDEAAYRNIDRHRLFVRDPADNQKLLEIADSSDHPEIVWSEDGTVVAVIEEVRSPGLRLLGHRYVGAYDFKKRTEVLGDETATNQEYSRVIEHLIRSRGGKRPAEFSSGREVGPWKWDRKQYKSQDSPF